LVQVGLKRFNLFCRGLTDQTPTFMSGIYLNYTYDMRWTVEKRGDLGFGLALLILTIISVASYLSITKPIGTADGITHTGLLRSLKMSFPNLKMSGVVHVATLYRITIHDSQMVEK
jgi:hypothetical protein